MMLDSISIHMPEGRRKPCMKIQDLVSCSNFWAFSGACAIIPSKQIVPVLCGLLEYVKATYTILGCATSILFPSNHYSCEFSVHSRTRVDSPAYPGCGASCSLCHLVISDSASSMVPKVFEADGHAVWKVLQIWWEINNVDLWGIKTNHVFFLKLLISFWEKYPALLDAERSQTLDHWMLKWSCNNYYVYYLHIFYFSITILY